MKKVAFIILITGIVFASKAQSFSLEYDSAYQKYLVACAANTGNGLKDSLIAQNLKQSQAYLKCARKASCVLEVLATREMTGGLIGGAVADLTMAGNKSAARYAKAIPIFNERADSILRTKDFFLNAMESLGKEIGSEVGLSNIGNGRMEHRPYLIKNLSEYDNETLALFIAIFWEHDEVYPLNKDEAQVVIKRFRNSGNPYLMNTADSIEMVFFSSKDEG